MEQFIRAKVVMLPTENNKQGIYHNPIPSIDKLHYWDKRISNYYIAQHLHITSDDEIKEGNSILNPKTGKIEKELGKDEIRLFWEKEWKVIISSTDTSLNLHQPSQQFIEKYIEEYNKGNIITDVLVEYEQYDFDEEWSEIHGAYETYKERLKINPKDNTITIKKVKDSYSREEVINLLYKSRFHKNSSDEKFDKWAEENL